MNQNDQNISVMMNLLQQYVGFLKRRTHYHIGIFREFLERTWSSEFCNGLLQCLAMVQMHSFQIHLRSMQQMNDTKLSKMNTLPFDGKKSTGGVQ